MQYILKLLKLHTSLKLFPDPSNVCRSLQMVYDRMDKENYNKDYYSKCLAKHQVDFVKRVPSRAKDVIRLLKYWNYNENVGSLFCTLNFILFIYLCYALTFKSYTIVKI